MIADYFKDTSNFVKLILILFSITIGFLIFMVLATVIAIPVFNLDISNFSSSLDPSNPQNIGALKFLQAAYSIGLFVFPPFVIAFFLSGRVGEYLKLNKQPALLPVIIAGLTIFFAFPVINFMLELNQNISFPESLSGLENTFKELEKEAQTTTDAFLATDSLSVFIVNLFILAVIPAIGEELLFRGIFQRLFHDWSKNIHFAIWFSAFLFSAMHFQFYGTLPRMVLGAFFGYLFYWSRNMWIPIFAHFLNNAFAVSIYYINDDIAKEAETIGTKDGAMSSVIISVILVTLLIYTFYLIEKDKKAKLEALDTNTETEEQKHY